MPIIMDKIKEFVEVVVNNIDCPDKNYDKKMLDDAEWVEIVLKNNGLGTKPDKDVYKNAFEKVQFSLKERRLNHLDVWTKTFLDDRSNKYKTNKTIVSLERDEKNIIQISLAGIRKCQLFPCMLKVLEKLQREGVYKVTILVDLDGLLTNASSYFTIIQHVMEVFPCIVPPVYYCGSNNFSNVTSNKEIYKSLQVTKMVSEIPMSAIKNFRKVCEDFIAEEELADKYNRDLLRDDIWLSVIFKNNYNTYDIKDAAKQVENSLKERYLNCIHNWSDEYLQEVYHKHDGDGTIVHNKYFSSSTDVIEVNLAGIKQDVLFQSLLKVLEKLQKDGIYKIFFVVDLTALHEDAEPYFKIIQNVLKVFPCVIPPVYYFGSKSANKITLNNELYESLRLSEVTRVFKSGKIRQYVH